jgi:TrmH family RNA methyltransferase
MSNFGFSYLRVVQPFDLAFRAARSAVGATGILTHAEEFPNIAEAVADCTLVVGTTAARHRELRHSLKGLEAGGRLIRRRLQSERVALLFGSEKRGLSTQDLSHCHWLMRIPTREQHLSMNLGQAVAVCLYELTRDPKKVPTDKQAQATAGATERVVASLFEALQRCGYVKADTGASAKPKIRRLVGRLSLQAEDAEVWLGMLRQMLWKMKAN